MPNKVLLLFAHPSLDRSEVNRPMFKLAKAIHGVTAVDLYYDYPSFRININAEQQRLLEHQIVIFQFPLYWYSSPSLLKEWQDLVLEYGFAYGGGGKALQGKTFFVALSAGGTEHAYCSEGHNHYSVKELLHPLEQMANLCGMNYLPPFTLFGARTASEEQRLSQHLQQWQSLLKRLVNTELPMDELHVLKQLNDWSELKGPL